MISLKKNISWNFSANVLYAASQWFIISMIAKLMGAETLGIYALGMAIVGPVFSFSNFNLRSAQATDVRDAYNFSDYLGFRALTSVMSLAFICLLVFVLPYSNQIVEFSIILAMAKFVESFSDLSYGALQKVERMDLLSKSLIIRGVLSSAGFVLALVVFSNLVLSAAVLVAVNLMVFTFYDVPALRANNISFRFLLHDKKARQYWSLFKVVLPLGVVVLVNTLATNIPRYAIEHYVGLKELGVYSGIAYFIMVGSTLVNALGQSATPRLAKLHLQDQRGYKNLLAKLCFATLIMGVCGVAVAFFIGDWVLLLVYNEEFLGHGMTLVWVMVAGLILYVSVILGVGITARRQFAVQSRLSVLFLLTIVATVFLLVPIYGLRGAVYSLCISYFVKLLMNAWCIYFLQKDSSYVVEVS